MIEELLTDHCGVIPGIFGGTHRSSPQKTYTRPQSTWKLKGGPARSSYARWASSRKYDAEPAAVPYRLVRQPDEKLSGSPAQCFIAGIDADYSSGLGNLAYGKVLPALQESGHCPTGVRPGNSIDWLLPAPRSRPGSWGNQWFLTHCHISRMGAITAHAVLV